MWNGALSTETRMNHAFVVALLSWLCIYLSVCFSMWRQLFLFLFIFPRTLLQGRLSTAANNRIRSFIVTGNTHTSLPPTTPCYPTFIISPSVWKRGGGGSSKVPAWKCLSQESWCSEWAAFHAERKKVTRSHIYFLSHVQPFHHLVQRFVLVFACLPRCPV